jgi:Tfp pilus assembly protein PilE
MGQQQLLLIILGVIIVGIAVAVGITMFQDNAVDQNRSAVISDLTTLAAKAQQYYAKPTTLGGGGNSFVGLTADATGLGLLASVAFTNNANGTYTITVAGTANPNASVTLHGVGKTEITTGVFPTYDMVVTSQNQAPAKIQ